MAMQPCPKLPSLTVSVPERDFLGEMQSFLQGTLPMQPAPEKHSTSASGSTTK